MSTVQSSLVKNRAKRQHKTRLEVFVSYAKEDALLVRDIREELSKPFGLLLGFFVDTETIKDGDDWRAKINERLDSADILLIISTGQQRGSHDFPGFEVGYFSRSIKERPSVDQRIGRQIIPLIIGGKAPSAVLDIQGIIIQQEDIFNFEVAPGDLSSEAKFLQSLPADNSFRKLLLHLRDIVTAMSQIQLTDNELSVLDKNINECAARLYKRAFAYLQGRIYAESFPERKLIIRTALPPLPAEQDLILSGAMVELVGQSFDLFGLPERPRQHTWSAFMSEIARAEIATQWREGIRTLVAAALCGTPADNYYFVSSLRGDRSFRLFVSLNRTYYSGQKEVHIYIVERAPTKDYGDSKTTKLLKAISIGLRYRSLFLESTSPFCPRLVGFYLGKDLRPAVAELWQELQILLADAKQAKLDDPELLAAIYNNEPHLKIDELATVWAEAENNLNKITHEVMGIDDDKVAAIKPAFMAALKQFCDQTEKMNREFTASALRALEAEITSKLGKPRDSTDAPSGPALA